MMMAPPVNDSHPNPTISDGVNIIAKEPPLVIFVNGERRIRTGQTHTVISIAYQEFLESSFGRQKYIRAAARKASPLPNRKGAEGPNPAQSPTPCHSKPAIREAGKSMIPRTAL
jgi:hypothetical protein